MQILSFEILCRSLTCIGEQIIFRTFFRIIRIATCKLTDKEKLFFLQATIATCSTNCDRKEIEMCIRSLDHDHMQFAFRACSADWTLQWPLTPGDSGTDQWKVTPNEWIIHCLGHQPILCSLFQSDFACGNLSNW